jgi:hypothetical protein
MKSWVRLSILCTALLIPQLAHAAPRSAFQVWIDKLRAEVPVPAGWDGIWDHTDSVYICGFGPLQAVRDTDTTCVGQEFVVPIEGGFTCTGSGTTTTFHMDCNGTTPYDVGCDIIATGTYDGTRTGSTYYAVSQINGTFSPPGCQDPAPPTVCLTIHVHATRLGDAPPAYCATPTQPSTWGSMKARYR